MADTTNYTWLFDLRESNLKNSISNDYLASVHTAQSINIDDIASSIASDRTDLREDTIKMVARLLDAKVREYICRGYTVVTGAAVFKPSITGVFTGTNGDFGNGNACRVCLLPSKTLRSEVAQVTPKFSGNVLTTGGARIALVTDRRTGLTNGTITPGGALIISGRKIKCVGSDGTSLGIIRFTNTATGEETLIDQGNVGANNPKELVIITPSTLTAGSYELSLDTYYTTGNKLLQSARTITYGQILTVAQAE